MSYPAIILIILLSIVPAVIIFGVSLFETNLLSWEYVGLENYQKMWGNFGRAMLNSLIYVAVVPCFGMILSTGIALNICRYKKGQNFFRGAYYVPVFSAGIIIAAFWRWFYNHMVPWIVGERIEHTPITIAFVIIMSTMGAQILLISIAISHVNTDQLEAAVIDGASEFQLKTRVILPQILPALSVLLLFSIIGSLQIWETIYMLAPFDRTASMMYRVFADGFQFGKYGMAAAESVVILLIILTIGIIREKMSKERL